MRTSRGREYLLPHERNTTEIHSWTIKKSTGRGLENSLTRFQPIMHRHPSNTKKRPAPRHPDTRWTSIARTPRDRIAVKMRMPHSIKRWQDHHSLRVRSAHRTAPTTRITKTPPAACAADGVSGARDVISGLRSRSARHRHPRRAVRPARRDRSCAPRRSSPHHKHLH